MVDAVRVGKPQQNAFYGEEAAGLQRIAPQCQCEGKNKLCHQRPSSDYRSRDEQYKRIQNKKRNNGLLIPAG